MPNFASSPERGNENIKYVIPLTEIELITVVFTIVHLCPCFVFVENIFVYFFIIYEASRGAGAPSVPVNRLVLGSISTREDEIFIYILYFYFFALVSSGKRSVEFRHSTRNASRN